VLHRFFLRNGKTNGHKNSYLGDRIFVLLVGRENLRPSGSHSRPTRGAFRGGYIVEHNRVIDGE
jgi:hypothetical protein